MKDNNVNIKLFTNEDYSIMTILVMTLHKNYNPNEVSINKYLFTVIIDKIALKTKIA